MRLRTLAMLATIPLAGCYPFVSSGTFDASYCDLDEDGDGAKKCVIEGDLQVDYDCDDNPDSPVAAQRSPDLEEIAYDGIDNDCDGEDLLDQDEDGYPGITREAYEALGLRAWPDLPDELDCNDDDDTIFPEEDNETYYDGIDQNCDDKCDYDADGDEFADARQGQGNDCGIPATDCLDSNEDVYPEAPGEVYYDGIDQDCDGVNDYDPDGDGHAWAGYETANTSFLDRHGYDDTIVAFDECFDIDDSPLTDADGDPVDPLLVNTEVAELFLDGIDGNCSDLDSVVENDFDRDGDGFMPSGQRTEFLAYVDRYVNFTRHDGERPYEAAFTAAFGDTATEWGDYYDSHDNDCNDADATVLPGALEVLGDSVDQDCDGDANTTPFRFGGYVWDGVGNPVVRKTSTDFVVAAVATNSVDFGSGAQDTRVATFSFDLDAGPDDPPFQQPSPSTLGAADGFSPALGMTSFSTGYYVGHAFDQSSRTRLRGAVAVDDGGRYSDLLQQTGDPVSGVIEYTQVDMRCDGATSTCWVLACDNTGMQYSEFTDSGSTSGFTEERSGEAAIANVVDCFVSTQDAAGLHTLNTISTGGGVRAWEVDGAGFADPASTNPFSSFDLDHASSHGDWLVLGHESTGLTLWRSNSTQRTVLSSRSTDDADVAFQGSTAYVAAVGGSSVWLAFGNPAGAMTEVSVPFVDSDGTSYTPQRVSIETSDSRTIVVISGTDASGDDVVGWMILQTS